MTPTTRANSPTYTSTWENSMTTTLDRIARAAIDAPGTIYAPSVLTNAIDILNTWTAGTPHADDELPSRALAAAEPPTRCGDPRPLLKTVTTVLTRRSAAPVPHHDGSVTFTAPAYEARIRLHPHDGWSLITTDRDSRSTITWTLVAPLTRAGAVEAAVLADMAATSRYPLPDPRHTDTPALP